MIHRSIQKTTSALVFATAIAVGAMAPTSAVAAPGDIVGYIGTCAFIESPTAAVHTECPGADLRMSVGMLGGIDLDYANFEGANLAGTYLLVAASSANHMRLAGADLTGTTIGYDLDFSGGSLKGAALGGSTLMTSDLSGLDLSGTNFGGANLHESVLKSTNLSNTVFTASSTTGGMSIAGSIVTGAVLPLDLDGGDQSGVDFSTAASIPAGSHYKGSNLSGSVFDRLELADLNVDGSNLAGSSFAGVTFTAGGSFSARGANFIRSDFTGVDFTPLGYENLDGSPFAFAELSGSTFRLSPGGYYADANFDGSTLYGNGGGAVFHRASMVDVVVLGGDSGAGAPLVLSGAQFHDADLSGADFDNTSLNGAQFIRADMAGMKLQSVGVNGFAGLVIIDSDLTGATLPAAMNLNGWDSQKWLFGQFIQNSTIDGTSLANEDIVATASPGAPSAAVAFPLPQAFANTDGQLPYGPTYDGNYWWGARYSCDHESGDTFPVGTTTVACKLNFEHTTGPVWQPPVALDLAASVFYDPFDSASYGYGIIISGLGDPAQAAIAEDLTIPAGIDYFDVGEYKYLPRFIPTDAGVYTTSTTSFTVTVTAAPTIGGDLADGIVGTSYSSSLTLTGYPAPTVALKAGTIPQGLTLGTDGSLSGTPAAGAGGRYELTLEAINSIDSVEFEQELWIIDPALELQSGSSLTPGDQVAVTGSGFTPGGDVEVWLHSTPQLVATVTADVDGNVVASFVPNVLGVHHVELVDVTTAARAISPDFLIAAVLPTAFPQLNPEVLPVVILAALLIAGGALALLGRRRAKAVTS